MTAPVGSETVPWMLPVPEIWAYPPLTRARSATQKRTKIRSAVVPGILRTGELHMPPKITSGRRSPRMGSSAGPPTDCVHPCPSSIRSKSAARVDLIVPHRFCRGSGRLRWDAATTTPMIRAERYRDQTYLSQASLRMGRHSVRGSAAPGRNNGLLQDGLPGRRCEEMCYFTGENAILDAEGQEPDGERGGTPGELNGLFAGPGVYGGRTTLGVADAGALGGEHLGLLALTSLRGSALHGGCA